MHFLFVIGQFKKSSVYPFGQINCNLVRNTYGMFCIKSSHLVQIGKQTWSPWEILVSDWLDLKKNHSPLKVLANLYDWCTGSSQQIFLIFFGLTTNLVATGSTWWFVHCLYRPGERYRLDSLLSRLHNYFP